MVGDQSPAQAQGRLSRLADLLIRNRLILLLAAVFLTAAAAVPASQLEFDRSIESLHAPDDPHLARYLESKRLFGGDEFVVVAYTDPSLLESASLVDLRSFADRLQQVPGVEENGTQHLADVLEPADAPLWLTLLLRLRSRAMLDLCEGLLVGEDRETAAIIVRLLPHDRSPVPREETFAAIRKLADAHDRPAYVVGQPIMVFDMFRFLEEDGRMLFRVSLALLALVIFFLFRSIRFVVLPLLVVVATIIWTEAILVLSQIRLSMVSSMLTSLVTIIGVATVMHVTIHFRDLRKHLGRIDALRQTFVDLLPAVFWTCATTAAGFGALLSSDITPVKSFGLMMALATLMVLAACAMILPGGVLLGRVSSDPRSAPAEKRLTRLLSLVSRLVDNHPGVVGGTMLALVAFSVAGLFRLEMQTNTSKNFRESTPIVQSQKFVEENLGGAGTWEVNFATPQRLTPEYLDRVRGLAARLRSLGEDGGPGLTKVVALTDLFDLVPDVPFSPDPVAGDLYRVNEIQPALVEGLYNQREQRMRLILRARERQATPDKLALIDTVRQMAAEEFDDAETTGLFVLLTYLIDSLMRDQVVSLILASVGIAGLMTLAFASLRIGLISLLPNLFPIALVVGAMGWIGMPINIGTAMIASVSVGLTVDFSIHYLFAYRRARDRGLNFGDALEETNHMVGSALVFATFSLVAGFSVLTLSRFIPLVHFGLLVSVAMLGGLIGNLGLLPLLLRLVEPRDAGSQEDVG